ncbi:YlzJ-like family protein [Candidatus Soleaferrea massiliensis]|uniref:YlzJ-like family protein n=1 Tax=Candidatus Soleaferrea massiliensis TaxID=1470354 RepID=UPI00058C8E60|nr:YlzJ-like family protein [Candidatus Soleaferrea massiliensis]
MLYTVVPIELLSYPAEEAKTEFKNITGGMLEMCKQDDGYKVVRLISTDPKMYLDDQYSPGRTYQDRH